MVQWKCMIHTTPLGLFLREAETISVWARGSTYFFHNPYVSLRSHSFNLRMTPPHALKAPAPVSKHVFNSATIYWSTHLVEAWSCKLQQAESLSPLSTHSLSTQPHHWYCCPRSKISSSGENLTWDSTPGPNWPPTSLPKLQKIAASWSASWSSSYCW